MKYQYIVGTVGNEMAKRAIEVALSGNHSIVLVATIGSQAEPLIKAAKQLAKDNDIPFEGDIVTLCPCSAYANPVHECHCEMDKIKEHMKGIANKIHNADIIVETTAPLAFETNSKAEPYEDVIKRIKAVKKAVSDSISPHVEEMLDIALNDMSDRGWFHNKTDKIMKTREFIELAKTIASMEGCTDIEMQHMAEAILYQYNYVSKTVNDFND